MRKICITIFFILSVPCTAQDVITKALSTGRHQGKFVLSLANNHMLQNKWRPYNNQAFADISYIWMTGQLNVALDAGLSIAFDFNGCEKCVSAASSSDLTYDADITSLHFGIGKWWATENTSAFVVSGGILAMSEYRKYFPAAGTMFYDYRNSIRKHAGLYAKAGIDWYLGAGKRRLDNLRWRVGPFLEAKVSSGQTRQDLYLNINSIAFGIMFGLSKKPR